LSEETYQWVFPEEMEDYFKKVVFYLRGSYVGDKDLRKTVIVQNPVTDNIPKHPKLDINLEERRRKID